MWERKHVGEKTMVERGICGKERVSLSFGIYRPGPDSSPWLRMTILKGTIRMPS
jgi:hypothetical protein